VFVFQTPEALSGKTHDFKSLEDRYYVFLYFYKYSNNFISVICSFCFPGFHIYCWHFDLWDWKAAISYHKQEEKWVVAYLMWLQNEGLMQLAGWWYLCMLLCRDVQNWFFDFSSVSVQFKKNTFVSAWVWFGSVKKYGSVQHIIVIYTSCNSWVVNFKQILQRQHDDVDVTDVNHNNDNKWII